MIEKVPGHMTKELFKRNVADFVQYMGLTPSFTEEVHNGITFTIVWLSGIQTDVALQLDEMEKSTDMFDHLGLHRPTVLYYLTITKLEVEAHRIAKEMFPNGMPDAVKALKDLPPEQLKTLVSEMRGRVLKTGKVLDDSFINLFAKPSDEVN